MENSVQPEQELEKHDDLVEETPLMQTNEPVLEENKEDLADPTKKLKDELAEAKDKYLRLYAEFENFRRRSSKEKLEMIQSANEQLLQSLLPVADDFERAEKSFKALGEKEAEGFFSHPKQVQKNTGAIWGEAYGTADKDFVQPRPS